LAPLSPTPGDGDCSALDDLATLEKLGFRRDHTDSEADTDRSI